jgi:hypothetical protein
MGKFAICIWQTLIVVTNRDQYKETKNIMSNVLLELKSEPKMSIVQLHIPPLCRHNVPANNALIYIATKLSDALELILLQ